MELKQYTTDPFKWRIKLTDQDLADICKAAKAVGISNEAFLRGCIENGISNVLEEIPEE